jgi:hypothetical protein
MITKDQANSITDQLLDQQRAEALRAKNAAASRIPFFYQCPELQLLEPWQRAEVIREARRSLCGNWGISACMIAWGLAFVASWYLLVPAATQSTFILWWLAMLVFPQFVLRVSLVRLHVKYLARLRQFPS